MKLHQHLKSYTWLSYTIAACSAVLLYVCLMHLDIFCSILSQIFSYVSPVLYAVIFAYLLDPIVRFVSERCLRRMHSRKAARAIGVVVTVILLLAVLTVLFVAFLPHLVTSVDRLVDNMEGYVETAHTTLTELSVSIPFIGHYLQNNVEWSEIVRNVLEWLPKNLPAILDASMRIGTGLVNAVLVFIIALYMLMDKERLLRGMKNIIRLFIQPKAYIPVQKFFRHCNHIILRYVGSNLLDALIIFGVNFLFMAIVGLPYGLLISVIVSVTNLLPTFGPFIGGALGGLILLLVNPWQALWFLIWTLFLQLVDGYVIKPHLFGDAMGLPAVWVLVSIIVGGRILGILGVLLGIPAAAICSFLLEKIIEMKTQQDAEAESAETENDSAEDAPPEAEEDSI